MHTKSITLVGHCEIDTFDSLACHNLLGLLISLVVKFLFWEELKLFLQVTKNNLIYTSIVWKGDPKGLFSPQILNKVLMNIEWGVYMGTIWQGMKVS